MFDVKTCIELKYYVYMLINPETNRPFYIGKGENNRVFEHVENVKSGKARLEPKNKEIKEITDKGLEVKHVIVHHGMDEETAFLVEASLIDTLNSIDCSYLTNLVAGHDIEHGLMSDTDISGKYSAVLISSLPNDCLVININKGYKRGMTSDQIYRCVKEFWPFRAGLNPSKFNTVLAEYHGLIVEVYDAKEWYSGISEYNQGTKSRSLGKKRVRYGFNGEVAREETRQLYLGKRIPITTKTYPILYPETVNARLIQNP